ncbi:hypothetical protein AURDEDRAFT_114811 [Auricularia subglabra TFB-10046 SS5]|nr:hypothetical protein AURDEDRAFT_114811 [Auricularia subglabra TFB-10046 SS5]
MAAGRRKAPTRRSRSAARGRLQGGGTCMESPVSLRTAARGPATASTHAARRGRIAAAPPAVLAPLQKPLRRSGRWVDGAGGFVAP